MLAGPETAACRDTSQQEPAAGGDPLIAPLAELLGLSVAGGVGAAGKEAAIGGYCPVAYVKMGKAVKGDARWSSERDGQTFLFSAAQAKEMFDKAPDQFRVAYHG
jgi:YHS domain-containing protein